PFFWAWPPRIANPLPQKHHVSFPGQSAVIVQCTDHRPRRLEPPMLAQAHPARYRVTDRLQKTPLRRAKALAQHRRAPVLIALANLHRREEKAGLRCQCGVGLEEFRVGGGTGVAVVHQGRTEMVVDGVPQRLIAGERSEEHTSELQSREKL